jgi:hypothetical protein
MMQEWQTNFNDPEKCQEGRDGAPRNVLEAIWFSDADLVEYAHTVYGMTAYYANFTASHAPVVPGQAPLDWTWTWTTPGGATSRVTLHDPALGGNVTSTLPWRIYWGTNEGVSYMDFVEKYENSGFGGDTSEGVLEKPMMWGRYGPSNFVQPLVNLEANAALSANIARFGDWGCTKPL